ncbi:PQQ-dependent sugar dehydrogenase [Gynuella sunshinyii]|uniref:Glucose/sorbosone dehydrogenase n=1 Tax=Gynuella sunshinyii YC6258 TaxID=1445510 RepID=A0A0C5VK60_9GAMM|nr:PQQ-dependent sugar dehydrogenase [Gynuella sunshinyii]AJQ95077.1 glucose/sorbosone dehydrogenase [Gynuella sunshinyii YC6258]
MVKKILLSALISVSLSETAMAVSLNMESCVVAPGQITDMTFISPRHGIIATQPGDLYWFKGCGQDVTKIGTVPGVSNDSWQAGLYGIAVNWGFIKTGNLYAYYAASVNDELVTRLSTFHIDQRGITKERVLLEIPQPYENGNGGALRLGPDGALYLGIGDGGGEGDPQGNSQNVQNLYGSILRIYPSFYAGDVYLSPSDNLRKFIPQAAPEIIAYGLRNPWKLTFDSQGDLIVADVGEHRMEEIDVIPSSMFGQQAINLGWNIKEGTECFDTSTGTTNPDSECTVPNEVLPAYQYAHSGDQGNSVTGGETLWLEDKEYYVFADFMTGYLGALDLDHPSTVVAERIESGKNWATFGKSPSGEVYVADYTGGVIYTVNLQP